MCLSVYINRSRWRAARGSISFLAQELTIFRGGIWKPFDFLFVPLTSYDSDLFVLTFFYEHSSFKIQGFNIKPNSFILFSFDNRGYTKISKSYVPQVQLSNEFELKESRKINPLPYANNLHTQISRALQTFMRFLIYLHFHR